MVALHKDSTAYTPEARSRLWHVPNPEIQTSAAARTAKRVAAAIAAGHGRERQFDETDLFVALHTCAHQASRRGAGRHERGEWQKRWFGVRDHVVELNLPLVYSMKARFGSRNLDQDDLLSEAMYGLVQAAERFDPWRGFRFSTYACHAIHRSMVRASKRANNRRRLFPVQHDVSFERPYRTETPADLYVERLQRALHYNLGELTELESKIIERRFPTNCGPRKTLQEIGDAVGLSKERVRQLQNSALDKLRLVLSCDPVLQ